MMEIGISTTTIKLPANDGYLLNLIKVKVEYFRSGNFKILKNKNLLLLFVLEYF